MFSSRVKADTARKLADASAYAIEHHTMFGRIDLIVQPGGIEIRGCAFPAFPNPRITKSITVGFDEMMNVHAADVFTTAIDAMASDLNLPKVMHLEDAVHPKFRIEVMNALPQRRRTINAHPECRVAKGLNEKRRTAGQLCHYCLEGPCPFEVADLKAPESIIADEISIFSVKPGQERNL